MNERRRASRTTLESDERSLTQRTPLPVLVIADDQNLGEKLATTLEGAGYPVVCTNSETDFVRLLSSWRVAGIVCCGRKLRSLNTTDFSIWLSQEHPDLSRRVVLLQKPFNAKRFLSAITKTIGEPPATERILMVDDEEPIREILAQMLGFSGYRCRAVAGGGQALKLLDSGERFDLVTSDLMNAPLDGVSFLEQIKSKFPEIPVLMITAVHDISVALACIRNGAYDFLLKPFEREQLIFAVRRALENRRLKLENSALRDKIARAFLAVLPAQTEIKR
jgi:DNA-binding NtrC family response regulator